jgi:6-phospho-3-hexuloisomerase
LPPSWSGSALSSRRPAHDSSQFGGSLFEQASLIVLDALIIDVTQDDPSAYEVMSQRHTNLE